MEKNLKVKRQTIQRNHRFRGRRSNSTLEIEEEKLIARQKKTAVRFSF